MEIVESPHQWRGRRRACGEGQGLQSLACCKCNAKPKWACNTNLSNFLPLRALRQRRTEPGVGFVFGARNTAQIQFFVAAKQFRVPLVEANRRQNVAESIGHGVRSTIGQLYVSDRHSVDSDSVSPVCTDSTGLVGRQHQSAAVSLIGDGLPTALNAHDVLQ